MGRGLDQTALRKASEVVSPTQKEIQDDGRVMNLDE